MHKMLFDLCISFAYHLDFINSKFYKNAIIVIYDNIFAYITPNDSVFKANLVLA